MNSQNKKKRHGILPPISSIKDDEIVYKKFPDIDFEVLGYFLSCHLIIERHLEQFLTVNASRLHFNFDENRLSFGQKISLLRRINFNDPKYDFINAAKCFNNLRNKFSHNLEYQIKREAMEPIVAFVKQFNEDKPELLDDPVYVIEKFTLKVCAYIAGYYSGTHDTKMKIKSALKRKR